MTTDATTPLVATEAAVVGPPPSIRLSSSQPPTRIIPPPLQSLLGSSLGGSVTCSNVDQEKQDYSKDYQGIREVKVLNNSRSNSVNIPTAIVKPKYQKIRHDDRQLLTNAGGFVNYGNNNKSNNNSSNNFDLCANKTGNSSHKRAFDAENKPKKCVGVVTPRKKNYNEIRITGNNSNSTKNNNIITMKNNCEWDQSASSNNAATDFNENTVMMSIGDKKNPFNATAPQMKKSSSIGANRRASKEGL